MSEKSPLSKAKPSSPLAQKELDKAEQQFQKFDEEVKSMTLDRMNQAPKEEHEQQTKISTREAQKSEIWLKPKRSMAPGADPKTGKREVFNERFRQDYEFAKEYVLFIAEHKEILGEPLNGVWTKPFPGIDAEEWDIPINKPVWGPRYLAEQIKKCSYHRLSMQESASPSNVIGADATAQYYGRIVVDSTVQRIDAIPVSQKKSIFMGSGGF